MKPRKATAPKPTKEERKAEQAEQELRFFRYVCHVQGITPTTGPQIFNVSRPTFWAWMNGRHRIPHEKFMQAVYLLIQEGLAKWEQEQRTAQREKEIEQRAAELNQMQKELDRRAAELKYNQSTDQGENENA